MVASSMIEAEGLTKHYGSVQALAGLDLTVAKGSILALLGPNGAGKTAAVRILTTRTIPDSGRGRVAGSTSISAGPGTPVYRRDGAGCDPGRAADGAAEPGDERGLSGWATGPPSAGPLSCWNGSTWPRRVAGWRRAIRAACADGSTSPPAWWRHRLSFSWTNRPRGSTPPAAPVSGKSC